ncbi:MAG: hypothetical protein ACC618_01505 [Patescibacteria group bacterium]
MPVSTKKILVAILVILVAGGGFVAGLILLRQRQELREEAAVPTGEAQVSVFPTTGNFNVGDTFPVSVFFNTGNIPVSGISVRLTYPFSGATPEFVASDIEINSVLLSSGDWTCPTKNVSAQAGTVNIDIACANISAAGFATSTDTLLATFNFTVDRVPVISPVIARFDPSQSVVTQKADGQDILLIPTSTGEYTVAGAAAQTPTPTATTAPNVTATPTLTPTATSTLTGTPTTTATPILTGTPSATGSPVLPDAGVGFPTIVGIGAGFLLIVGALIFAL